MEHSPLIRVVRMEFSDHGLNPFLQLFEETHHKISSFPGCRGVDLKKDPQNSQIRYTLSHWDSQEALDVYRNSDLFKRTWAKTKTYFAAKPQAWSLVP